jgi:hypothetical protein
MGVNKLDIEFEDEEEIAAREEAERKRSEVPEDVDLSFGAHDDDDSSGGGEPAAAPVEQAAPAQQAPAQKAAAPAPQKQAAPVQQAAAQPVQQPVQQQAAPAQFQNLPQQQIFIGPDYKLGDELKKVAASNQVLAIEIEARVKIEVTKELTKIIAENHAKNKLIEHKINKILTGINQKVPALKNELMTIKKLLSEHATFGEGEEGAAAAPAAAGGGDAAAKSDKAKLMEQKKRAALAAKKKKAA